MKIIVEKYGGTSVGSIEKIKTIATRVVANHKKGFGVVVVVSAMGKTTDDLVSLVDEISVKPRERELSMLLSTGEVVTCSLMAMAIQALGVNATSLTGPQCGIYTEGIHDNAKITNIDTTPIKQLLERGEIVVAAGYQGKNGDDITVLGRGGSDASAVALAAALNAELCHIYTDVAGVYTADPRVVKKASLLQGISYEEMLELAGSGAQIMMGRAVEIARKYELKVRVSSSFDNSPGTLITKENELEKVIITGVAVNKKVAMIDIFGLGINFRGTANILKKIKENHINIILLCSTMTSEQSVNLSFVSKPDDLETLKKILKVAVNQNEFEKYTINEDVSQISIVGSGIANSHGVAFEMFDILSKNKIIIFMTSTSEIKITVIIPEDKSDLAIQELHNKFELNNLHRNCIKKILDSSVVSNSNDGFVKANCS